MEKPGALERIMAALPVSGIDAQPLAWINGFLPKGAGETLEPTIDFFEPPAGQYAPYLDPVETMTLLFRAGGMSSDEAHALAVAEFAELRSELLLLNRPRLYRDGEVMDAAECVPVHLFLVFVRKRGMISEDLISFLEHAGDVICRIRTFRLPDDYNKPILLSELPALPPPKAMIEFFVGLQSDISWEIHPERLADGEFWPQPLMDWRESMRPISANLEHMLGEKVYHFQDLDDELDDDCCHRFLALHCWCALLPESNFVKYLLEVTGLADVEALKAALIDPASYTHPFTFNYAFVGIETVNCRFRYLPPGQKRRIGIAFRTEVAKLRAKEIALTQLGAEILFLAPQNLVTQDWLKEATPYGRSIGVWSNFDAPIAFLSKVDEIHIVSDEDRPSRGFDLKVGAELEILMWRAHQLGVKMFADSPSARVLGNPETCLEGCGVPERVSCLDRERKLFTDTLETLRLSADHGSSRLWSKDGKTISYDCIDIPFSLVKRIAAWQRDFDETLIPLLPETANDGWWSQHFEEGLKIAILIQQEMGNRLDVQIYREGLWVPVSDCVFR